MKNKGEINVGAVVVLFVGIIVALVLVTAMGPFTGTATRAQTLVNHTYTAPAAAGTYLDLEGQKLLNTPIITNATGSAVLNSGNYTITDTKVSTVDGVKSIRINFSAASEYLGHSVNASYQYGDHGYIEDSGGRGIFGLVLIGCAIAIVVFAIYPSIKDNIFDIFG